MLNISLYEFTCGVIKEKKAYETSIYCLYVFKED